MTWFRFSSFVSTIAITFALLGMAVIAHGQVRRPAVPHLNPVQVRSAMQNPGYKSRFTFVIAHRGSHGAPGCPENSACSIKAAYEAGADGIEFDIKTTADNQVVLGHDFTAGREVQNWTGKPNSPLWNLFTDYPAVDSVYYDITKPPFFINFDYTNSVNARRTFLNMSAPEGKLLNDTFDNPVPGNPQLTLSAALELVQTEYPMMIWLDVKNWETLLLVAEAIRDARTRFGNTGPLSVICLKLQSGVVPRPRSCNTEFEPRLLLCFRHW